MTMQIVTPTAGQTITRKNADGDISIILKPATLLLTLTVAMGAGDFDGQRCHVMSTNAITTLTMTVTGSVVNPLVGLAINGCGMFQWSAADSTWYRIGN